MSNLCKDQLASYELPDEFISVKLPFRRELSDSESDSLAKACTEAETEASPST